MKIIRNRIPSATKQLYNGRSPKPSCLSAEEEKSMGRTFFLSLSYFHYWFELDQAFFRRQLIPTKQDRFINPSKSDTTHTLINLMISGQSVSTAFRMSRFDPTEIGCFNMMQTMILHLEIRRPSNYGMIYLFSFCYLTNDWR